MKILGVTGWSGAGKTTLLVKLIPLLTARGLRVATLKHAHHAFDVDVPGKDSWAHRQAGACEVIVASRRRSAQIRETPDEAEPRLADLLRRLGPCDLVLVEGFKREPHPKLEVFRAANDKPPLFLHDATIVAVAADAAFAQAHAPVFPLDDAAAIAAAIPQLAREHGAVLALLDAHGAA